MNGLSNNKPKNDVEDAAQEDSCEEFLDIIKKEKVNAEDLDKALKVNVAQPIENLLASEKISKKKKKKKKKKTKPVEEPVVPVKDDSEIPVPKKDLINIPIQNIKHGQQRILKYSINKHEIGFDINTDTDEKNEFTKMFEILESQTKKDLGPEMDKKLHSVVEGKLKSFRKK